MDELAKRMKELWWIYVLQGVVTLLLGMIALFWPGLGLITLLYAITFYAIVVGVIDLVFGFGTIRINRTWWLNVLSGLVLIGIAAYLLRNPTVALVTFAALLGAVFVVRGLLETVSTILAGKVKDHILMLVAGLLAIFAGIVIWVYPVEGSLSYVWVLGMFAVIRGALDIANANEVRRDLKIK